MDFWEVLKERKSVREYSEEKIKNEDLEKIIDAARLAPTARKVEPWEFIVITSKKSLGELGEITDHGKFLAAAAAGIVVVSKDTKYYLEDCSAATENILLAATALGIGACWIAGDKKDYAGAICECLGVPQDYKLVSIVSLGYPKSKTEFSKKRPLESVLHWERCSACNQSFRSKRDDGR